ncbi:glycosyl transferase family protein [uncultured Sphingomonas sp.]|uniref:glycosyl transferase family protein n=1 Tax=uncultured Sphingomonas sp. TaxID=158754 RepID=UPI0035CBA8B4
MTGLLGIVDAGFRELLLFAAAGVLLGGIDDLAVDAIYWGRVGWRWLRRQGPATPLLADFHPAAADSRFAVFVPAWDEAGVIAPMLRLAIARLDHPGCTFFVGCYPNDRATIDAVTTVARDDPRVRPVVGERDGPTTKADCLNTLWRALLNADPGGETRAVILHDAEDVVHAGELAIFDALIGRNDIVQLPVLPLIDPERPLVSGVVADEFAESHAKIMVVRELVGAGLPLAGVGCAIATPLLHALAGPDGMPFDADSLCEDYEIGLRATAHGGSACFARVAEFPGGPAVAIREYFPATLPAAVRQKARWMTGIALAGWDRTGWAGPLAIGDHWMRARDRRAPLAMLVLCACYLALLAWGASAGLHRIMGTSVAALPGWTVLLVRVNAMLLCWRMAMRALFTGRAYGRREAWRSIPRLLVGNLIALLAARRAFWCYLLLLAGGKTCWDKTVHAFPAEFGGAGPVAVDAA